MRQIFGEAGEFQKLFIQGAMMGAVVGGTFGALAGSYYAFVTRSFWCIPMSALGSGASFGFIMGIGMVIRNKMDPKWCGFLENLTEEMEESKDTILYEDYKFLTVNDM